MNIASIASMNEWLTPGAVVWGAAGVGFLLLVLSGPASAVASSPRHDGATRVLKIALYFTVTLLVLFPALVLLSGEPVPGAAACSYALSFSLFCYFLGRNIGRGRGKREVSERIGMEMFDSVEEVQDRLYESRQRLATPGEVERSITAMAKAGKAGAPAEVLDVMVEEVEEE